MSFESDLKRMEEITELLKKEDTGIEEALELFEEASLLSKKLTKTLTSIQRKVEKIRSEDENEMVTEVVEEND